DKREPATPALISAAIPRDQQRRTFLRRNRGLGVYREPKQARRPRPATIAAVLIFRAGAPRHPGEAVVPPRSPAPPPDLIALRSRTVLDLGAQFGRPRARVLEREHGIAADRVLDRLAIALAAVAQRPRLHAARLHDEIQAVAVEDLLALAQRLPVVHVE